MRQSPYFPKNYEVLRSLVHKAAAGAECVVMQTGHFLLHYDETTKTILPLTEDALTEPRHASFRRDYAQFPILTWRLGLRLLASLRAKRKYVMIVVNDWQYIPSDANRGEFYAKYQCLPESYRRELDQYGGDISLLSPARFNDDANFQPLFFSETTLRNHYRKSVKRLIKRGELPHEATVHQEGEVVSCQLPDPSGIKREIYCSERSTDCAGETAQFLHEAAQATGCEVFLNLFPSVCWDFVEYGTQLGEKIFSPGIQSYLNIGMPSSEVTGEEMLISESQCSLHQETKV